MEELRKLLFDINQNYHIGIQLNIHEYLKTVELVLTDNFDMSSIERHELGSLLSPNVFSTIIPLIKDFTSKVKKKHNYH